MQPIGDLLLDLRTALPRGRGRQRADGRPDLDPVAVVDLGLLAPEHSAVEEGPVGTPEILQECPSFATLDGRVELANHRGAETKLAIAVAADDESRGDRERPALRPSQLDDQPETRSGCRRASGSWWECRYGLRVGRLRRGAAADRGSPKRW